MPSMSAEMKTFLPGCALTGPASKMTAAAAARTRFIACSSAPIIGVRGSIQQVGLYRRIGKGSVPVDDGPGGEFGVRVPAWPQDVHDAPAARQHVVGDQPAVTLPPHRL